MPRLPGPLCISEVGPSWIDKGTIALTRHAPPGPITASCLGRQTAVSVPTDVAARILLAAQCGLPLLPAETRQRLAGLLTYEGAVVIAGSVLAVEAAHPMDVGFTVDIMVGAVVVATIRQDAIEAAKCARTFYSLASGAATERDFQRAGQAFAAFVSLVGMSAVSVLLTKGSFPGTNRLPSKVPIDKEGASRAGASTYSLSVRGSEILKACEELRLRPYDDQTKKDVTQWCKGATIGYGHLIAQSDWDKYKNGITRDEAEVLFNTDAAPMVTTVRTSVTAKVTQNEFDALVMLVFNIGGPNFASSSVLKLVNDPQAKTNYTSLEAAWKAWNKSQGNVMKGLANRRNCEWKIYSAAVYERW